jgi:hypothetical protein
MRVSVLEGVKDLLFKIFSILKSENYIYLFFAIISFGICLIILTKHIIYTKNRRFLTVKRGRRSFIGHLTKLLIKLPLLNRSLNSLAIKISLFNRYSLDKNLEYASLACIIVFMFTLVSIAAFLPNTAVVWYIALSYVVMAVIFVVVVFIVFVFVAKQRFTNKMPDTFKLLNSRYIITGNILKAINISMEDFDKTVRREMFKIYEVLKKNNIFDINYTFKLLETTYKNEYFTLLLNLIKQAYYRGGNDVIKKQFEETTEEILLDIENQKDLSFTSRTYIFIALFLPFGVKFLESFNFNALGEKAQEFCISPLGIEVKIIFYSAFLLYLGAMLFMERTA